VDEEFTLGFVLDTSATMSSLSLRASAMMASTIGTASGPVPTSRTKERSIFRDASGKYLR